jgi:hypothetical protein
MKNNLRNTASALALCASVIGLLASSPLAQAQNTQQIKAELQKRWAALPTLKAYQPRRYQAYLKYNSIAKSFIPMPTQNT